MIQKTFSFKAAMWKWGSQKGTWYFVSVPELISKDIYEGYPFRGKGFGSVPVFVTASSSEDKEVKWKTGVFYDSKKSCYLLPIKATIRKNL